MHGCHFFLHLVIPLVREVPAVPYLGANATASHTSKYENKANDGRTVIRRL